MWWAVFITIVTGVHHRQTVIPPQTFSTYGECQEFADKIAETAPIPSRKVTIRIRCDEALGE